jgi:hypothetical protein
VQQPAAADDRGNRGENKKPERAVVGRYRAVGQSVGKELENDRGDQRIEDEKGASDHVTALLFRASASQCRS